MVSKPFLSVFICIFSIRDLETPNANKIYYMCECLRNGWICVQSDDWSCLHLFDSLSLHYEQSATVLQIVRQLCALGHFRGPDRVDFWTDRCRQCSLVTDFNPPVPNQECVIMAPLLDEFFQKPLSLLQLSRMEIRRLVGMNDFERRLKTLLLPPLLLEYVWRANEMLAGVSPLEDQNPHPI